MLAYGVIDLYSGLIELDSDSANYKVKLKDAVLGEINKTVAENKLN